MQRREKEWGEQMREPQTAAGQAYVREPTPPYDRHGRRDVALRIEAEAVDRYRHDVAAALDRLVESRPVTLKDANAIPWRMGVAAAKDTLAIVKLHEDER
jgi:hypothetical protein